jgi:hypothetical protein
MSTPAEPKQHQNANNRIEGRDGMSAMSGKSTMKGTPKIAETP